MGLFITSFLAGILTILAPCILSLLPIILGSSLGEQKTLRPLIVALSLGASVIIFTLLLKATTLLIKIPEELWQWLSGGLIIFFGFSMIFPTLWYKMGILFKFYEGQNLVDKVVKKNTIGGAILLGAAMGPVFTTCSPTYLLIVATVLPANFFNGLLNLTAYTIGLMLMLVLIGYGGRAIVQRLRFAANPNGWLKRSLGLLVLVTGIFIISGFNKTMEGLILNTGYNWPIQVEKTLTTLIL